MHFFRQYSVYIKEHWADDWGDPVTGLFCHTFEECCGPSIPQATLTYRYGSVKAHEEQDFAARTRLEINGWYVKVALTQSQDPVTGAFSDDRLWQGVVVDSTTSQLGNNSDGGNLPVILETGDQTFKCLGMEYLLEREIYDSSFAKNYDASAELEFERGIAFNMGGSAHNSRRIQGNMIGEGSGDKGSAVFTGKLSTAEEWPSWAIIDYLLTYHPPADDTGIDRMGWHIDLANSSIQALDAIRPKLDGHGESVKRLIDMVCDRRRSMSWKVVVDANDELAVQVFTFNKDNIDLPPGGGSDGGTIDANANQITIPFADDARVLDAVLFTSSASKFDRVIARGDRVQFCLSLQETPEEHQGTLKEDWTTELKDEYNDGGSTGAGYSSLDVNEQVDINKAARDAQKLHRVYRYFLWDPELVNSELPVEDAAGDVLVNNKLLVCWPPGGRFMSDLTLRYDLEYTTPEVDITDDKPDVSATEFMNPFAVIKDGTVYYNMHTMGKGIGNAPAFERHWTASLRMRRDQLGIVIDVHGEPGQHAIALDEFVPLPEEDGAPGIGADLRWQYIICTVALELDNWAEATYPEPETPLVADTDTVKTLIINVPDRQMHYVAKNTVFGLSTAGALFKTSEGGWIRDDSWELKWIARIAYEWYKSDRRAFEYTFHSLDCPYSVGQLVTELTSGDQTIEVNSVITSIVFDLLNGSYTLKTSFAEMDARGIL